LIYLPNWYNKNMSLRKKSNLKYNRMEKVEDGYYYFQLLFQDDNVDHFEEYYHPFWNQCMWWLHDGDGTCNSMTEYHGMYVLTLLRKLSIKTAKEVVDDKGWN